MFRTSAYEVPSPLSAFYVIPPLCEDAILRASKMTVFYGNITYICHVTDCDQLAVCQVSMSDDKANRDHHADQMNPNSDAYKARMDHQADQSNPTSGAHQAAADNRANQMNPNNPAYQASRQGGSDQSAGKGGKK